MKGAALALLLGLSTWAVASAGLAEPFGLSDRVAEHVREIRARNPELRDDAFAKMGGSSVASKAFLHCFASPYVDLGEHQALGQTIDYFDTGRRNSFNRNSEAAGVSWNLRYVLWGRPANFRKEIERTRARWALVLFGGNDAQNENERIYLRRLVYLVEQLEDMGVVPVLASALPRRNAYRNRWIRRFNAITAAVAERGALPYVDYYGALSALPRKGLAHDGVHPNVLSPGGLRAACQLTERGLRYGNNARNLLTLEMLDALRRIVADEAEDPREGAEMAADAGLGGAADAAVEPHPDAGREAAPHPDAGREAAPHPDPFPRSAFVTKSDLPLADTLPPRCGTPRPGSRLYRERIEISERTRLRASAFDLEGYKFRVLWARVDEAGERCVRRRVQSLEVDAQPGMWDLIVEVPERAAQEGQMLVLMTRNPR